MEFYFQLTNSSFKRMIFMKNMSSYLLTVSLVFLSTASWAQAEKEASENLDSQKSEKRSIVAEKFAPFTGKITKNKVRLRLQPNYEGPILREFDQNDYIVVLDETEDFYVVQPPNDMKGYVFRTYILDDIIEGDRVNIRIQPDREATILGQLKVGDRVESAGTAKNKKWLEVKLPSNIRFYIAKEYVERVGDIGLKDRLDQKRHAGYDLLDTTDKMSEFELRKPFDQMSITGIAANYQHLINDYSEFADLAKKAKESFDATQKAYTAKKIAYLEEQTCVSSSTIEKNKQLNAALEAQKNKISHLEQQLEHNRQVIEAQTRADLPSKSKKTQQLPMNMAAWWPVEESLFNTWSLQTRKHSLQEFYEVQKQQGLTLNGVIDPYTCAIKNKPGDYMLVDQHSKLPIAFLYSTQVNLQDYVGHEVSILVSPRDNHYFAFPAYFVLTIE